MDKLLRQEAAALAQRANFRFVYVNQPFTCGVDEAAMHFAGSLPPRPENLTITRNPTETILTIKPIKGCGIRRPMVIKMWCNP